MRTPGLLVYELVCGPMHGLILFTEADAIYKCHTVFHDEMFFDSIENKDIGVKSIVIESEAVSVFRNR